MKIQKKVMFMSKSVNKGQCGIAENLKKGITEMLILSFLEKENLHIYSITKQLDVLSDGVCKISYPYAAIYRLIGNGYIIEAGKKTDTNRLRQYYAITDTGKNYLANMKSEYTVFINGVTSVFDALKNA